jgi:hypothetical protein
MMVTIDIPADLNDEDETSFVWTFLDEARAPDLVTPGAIVVTGDAGRPRGCRGRRSGRQGSRHRRAPAHPSGTIEDYTAHVARTVDS